MNSFTVHWPDKNWERKSAILHCARITGSHTASNIKAIIQSMVQSWQLTDHVHVVLCDKGIMEAGLLSVGCVAHTFQLSVKRGLTTQCNLEATVALCHKTATHFSHSTVAEEKLRELQHTLQLPQHTIMQDVQTRWNSTYYMTESVLEQTLALVNYATHNDIPELTKAQWTLLENAVSVRRPMENVMR